MTRTLVIAIACAAVSSTVSAQTPAAAKADYDVLFARYLEAARTPGPPASSSLWLNSLMEDQRARRVNDLVTVRVEESIAASGSADASTSKSGAAAVGVGSFFGVEKKLPGFIDPANLAGAKHDTSFKGAGSTTRNGELTATLTARVSEVLPNGDLVIEGVREIEINGDRQIVVLTGVARVVDVGPGNVVFSSALGQLRIRYFGRGLIKDSLSPGWLIRVLNKIF